MTKKEFTKKIGTTGLERIRVKLIVDKGELKDFVFQYESFIHSRWREIVRYDLAHGFFHRDFISTRGCAEKTRIEIADLKTAASFAEQDIKDKWEFYKTKYLKEFNT